MSILIIAGGGKFGKKALDYGRKNEYKTILIDNDPNCFCAHYVTQKFDNINNFYSKMENVEAGEVIFLIYDISIIYELIIKFKPEYIIPVIPIHLSALILEEFLLENTHVNLTSDKDSIKSFVANVSEELLLTYNVEKGIAYLSYAKIDEICPDNCIGPEDFCPNFNREKPITITKYLKNFYKVDDIIRIQNDDKNEILKVIIIIESKQLMPGLGGIEGNDISHVFKTLENNFDLFLNKSYYVIIATTCNCHGVINFYRNRKR